MSRTARIIALATLVTSSTAAMAEDWKLTITVDNFYTAYYGTPTTTSGVIGSDGNWPTVETYNVTGRAPSDYLYVSTASDFGVAQGFIASFTNVSTGKNVLTGSPVWEVFPAGKYLQQLNSANPGLGFGVSSWPASLQPTTAQTNAAIAYASANGLWTTPSSYAGYDNDPSTPVAGANPPPYQGSAALWQSQGLPKNAAWIWYDSGKDLSTYLSYPKPFRGFNHDEFLVFRIAGAAEIKPQTGTLSVSKFYDANANGVQEPGEGPANGIYFNVFDSSGNLVPGGPFVSSGVDGSFTIPNLPIGTYTVQEVLPRDLINTLPLVQTVTITAGTTGSLLFGNTLVPPPPSLTIFKFNDVDGDGIYGEGDVPIANWPIDVTLADGSVRTYYTNGAGTVLLGNLIPGSFTVTEHLLEGWTPTTPYTVQGDLVPGGSVQVSFGNAIPEPTSMGVLVPALAGIARRRRA